MKKIKTFRMGLGILLIVGGLFCAWFWWTASNQQTGLASAMIRTPEDLSEQLPMLSAALKMLHVDIFAPSDDPGGIVTKLSGQFWRRTLCGVVLFLLGTGLLLLTRSESKPIRIAVITGRSIVIVFLCLSCFLIWWSWH